MHCVISTPCYCAQSPNNITQTTLKGGYEVNSKPRYTAQCCVISTPLCCAQSPAPVFKSRIVEGG